MVLTTAATVLGVVVLRVHHQVLSPTLNPVFRAGEGALYLAGSVSLLSKWLVPPPAGGSPPSPSTNTPPWTSNWRTSTVGFTGGSWTSGCLATLSLGQILQGKHKQKTSGIVSVRTVLYWKESSNPCAMIMIKNHCNKNLILKSLFMDHQDSGGKKSP